MGQARASRCVSPPPASHLSSTRKLLATQPSFYTPNHQPKHGIQPALRRKTHHRPDGAPSRGSACIALSLPHFRVTRYRAQTATQEARYSCSRLGAVVLRRQLAAGTGCPDCYIYPTLQLTLALLPRRLFFLPTWIHSDSRSKLSSEKTQTKVVKIPIFGSREVIGDTLIFRYVSKLQHRAYFHDKTAE